MEQFIVTGATGHIGNVMVRKLCEQGQNVKVLALPNEDLSPLENLKVDIVFGDVADRDFGFKFIGKDAVVMHLAGIIDIGTTPEELVRNVNVNGTKNIVDACIENKAKKLLYDQNKKIAAIAAECGFGSPIRFNLFFHEKMDMTPRQYRKIVHQSFRHDVFRKS